MEEIMKLGGHTMTDAELHAGNMKLIGGRLCLDFANTVAWRTTDHPQERLVSFADLVAWSQHAGIVTGKTAQHLLEEAARCPALASAVLERAVVLREAIYRVFSAVAGGHTLQATDIATLNGFLPEATSRLQLVLTGDGFAWSWTDDGSSLEQMLWPVVRSAAELLASGELNRVGVCAGDGCGWLFFDTSKNRSRRWCAMEDCGNRAKARRHYRRSRIS
jgi:predicted RNA-binding Zn ribbon-like protein